MIKITCPICESAIELKDSTKEGARFSCPTCFAQLRLRKGDGAHKATCALCKKDDIDCVNCDERAAARAEKDLI